VVVLVAGEAPAAACALGTAPFVVDMPEELQLIALARSTTLPRDIAAVFIFTLAVVVVRCLGTRATHSNPSANTITLTCNSGHRTKVISRSLRSDPALQHGIP
jgi:hypothetical protein